MRIIAIDGPAGSGKSTVARGVARRLGLPYLDTGAMYRSVAWAALARGVDPADADAVAEMARGLAVEVADRVTVDGDDVTVAIRSPEVSRAVSAVAANPRVRAEMVRRQQEWAARTGGGVVEGRDIGTVVFPHAELKVFLTASDDERARRRHQESAGVGFDTVAADIRRRDTVDSTRAASPLKVADDAVVLDTTGQEVEQVIAQVLAHVQEAGG